MRKSSIATILSLIVAASNLAGQEKSEYFANDKWTPGHEITYKPAPDAEVKFK